MISNGSPLASFLKAVEERTICVGIVGLGYVGLPLAVEVADAGFPVIGFDVSSKVVASVNKGISHVQDVPSDRLSPFVEQGLIRATSDPSALAQCDTILLCVPTPLNKLKDPDLAYVVSAASAVRDALRPGQLIVLESTTYPGTTREVLQPLLEESGLKVGRDIFLCYSPERVDPGNKRWHTKNTPKVLGGITEACVRVGTALYKVIFDTIVPVSSAEAAELTKVYENTFRMINIALANELAQACDKLDVDVWEVIDAAATKPFGFMRFTPGPGLGGHCIPLDPHYLSWKMRSLAYKTRLIELASEINAEMPAFVVRKIARALNDESKPVRDSRILVLGVAYKPGIDDLRESPALEIMRLLQEEGGQVFYHDPYCPEIKDDGHTELKGIPMQSIALTDSHLQDMDAVVVVTNHAEVDYQFVVDHAGLIIDARGALRGITGSARVVGLSGQEQTYLFSDCAINV
ncbi:MAG TPA: nucleotide sugar dehydrogenase [Rhodothermales bacterium]|nr:nucleotide sugar dehydrogenase [Rhodothermales bacterium]